MVDLSSGGFKLRFIQANLGSIWLCIETDLNLSILLQESACTLGFGEDLEPLAKRLIENERKGHLVTFLGCTKILPQY